jgi:hypothetical protein
MNGKLLEDEVRDACRRGVPWHVLAELLYMRINSSASPSETAEIKSVACGVSGYSVGLLNRYVSAFARTKLIADASHIQSSDLLSSVFNGVEAAVKLYDVDPERGLDALLQLKDGKTTLAAVRSRLTEAKELSASRAGLHWGVTGMPRRLAAVERERRQATILQSLQKGFAPLSGRYEKIDWRKTDRLLRCDGLYRVDDRNGHDGRFSAIEVVDAGPESDFNYIDTLIPASILRSTFFKNYYLAFWTVEADVHAKRAARLLKWLEVSSIGVLTVEKDGRVRGFPLPYDLSESDQGRCESKPDPIPPALADPIVGA